jgi:DNA-binding NtrC family response regulator
MTVADLICPIEHGSGDSLPLLVEAAMALATGEPWPTRWTAALRAVAPVLAWSRAVMIGSEAWQVWKGQPPTPLPPRDPVRERAAGCAGSTVLRVPSPEGPVAAVVAPIDDAVTLYLELAGPPPALLESAFLAHFVRLLARHLPSRAEDHEPAGFAGIIGRSAPMQSLFAQMTLLARSEVAVHITGETGTGKERVAKALHAESPRAGRPFVGINASSLSDELFEAELFGHVKGAFTGAFVSREGHVAAAEGGTLFIDEVTDLSARAQAKLLRFLQEREYRRIGETAVRRADFRLITASNAPLEQRVAAGAFRRDLMYRLNVMVLALPPLRERREDVAMLARHFLGAAAARAGVAPPRLSAPLVHEITAYDWPGNVRELENEMSRLVVLAGQGPVRVEHLSFSGAAPPEGGRLREARRSFERDYVARALTRNGGNRARTASELGMTRQALLGMIKRLGI